MKQCRKCSRTYTDETLNFCLDDGEWLTEATVPAEPATSILHSTDASEEAPTRAQMHTTAEAEPRGWVGGWQWQLAGIGLAIAVLVGGFFGYRYYIATVSGGRIDSIAVLAFENGSGDPSMDYLSDGLAESLIYRLSQFNGLKVTPRSVAFRYKAKDTDPIKIGNELGVTALLSGIVSQRGDSLEVSVELVDVRSAKVLWGEQYVRKTSDLLQTQKEIAREIVEKLDPKVRGTEKVADRTYTENNDAYQLYLKGRFYWNKRTGSSINRSIEYFNQALEKDPNYALAWAGLADAYGTLPVYSAGLPSEYAPKAIAAANKALEIDESLAEPHVSLGMVLLYYKWDLQESERHFQRAIELNPNYATAHQWYGVWNLASGRQYDKAETEVKRALELEPLSLIINTNLGDLYVYSRQFDRAIEQLRKTLDMDPNFYRAHWALGLAYEGKGMLPEAIAEYKKAAELDDDPRALAMLSHAYALSGEKDMALSLLEGLKASSKQKYVEPSSIALIYSALGNKDEAFKWLETAYAERDPRMVRVSTIYLFDPLRADPRFADLVKRMGFPQ